MVLISIIITFAVLSVDTGPEELRREGARLASLLDLTSEQAVMNGREYRVVFQRHGYSFEELQDSKWQPSGDELLKPHTLPEGMMLELTLEDEPVPLARETDTAEDNKASLLLLSSGEIPSFELIVSGEGMGKFSIREEEGRIVSSTLENNNLT